ncbi:MAG: hypothetical protein ACK5HY_11340 [Parahaliea sp.]
MHKRHHRPPGSGWILAGLLTIGLAGCSGDKPRDWSGDYEPLSGEACELALGLEPKLRFSLVATAGGGTVPQANSDLRSYSLRMSPAAATHFGIPVGSPPAVEDDQGRLTFTFDSDERYALGVRMRATMTMRLAPHPDKPDLALLYFWSLSNGVNFENGITVDVLATLREEETKDPAKAFLASYNGAPAICVGKVDRLTAEQRQQAVAKQQAAAAKEAAKRQAAAEKAQAKAAAERQAKREELRSLGFAEYYNALERCGDHQIRDTVPCQVARELRGERLDEQKRVYLTQYGSYEDNALAEFLGRCPQSRDELVKLACSAASEVATERAAAAREAEKQRLRALPFVDYVAEYEACQGKQTTLCSDVKAMYQARIKTEADQLAATVGGAELRDRRETLCKGWSAPRSQCEVLRIAGKATWDSEVARLVGEPKALEKAYNDCVERHEALRKTREYSIKSHGLINSFECKTATEALQKLGVRTDFRQPISLSVKSG